MPRKMLATERAQTATGVEFKNSKISIPILTLFALILGRVKEMKLSTLPTFLTFELVNWRAGEKNI